MQIDIKNVAKLARLKIEEEKLFRFEKEMQAILGMVENLPDIAEGDIGLDESNPMELRKDDIIPSLKREQILKNAPQIMAGCVVVPKTVE